MSIKLSLGVSSLILHSVLWESPFGLGLKWTISNPNFKAAFLMSKMFIFWFLALHVFKVDSNIAWNIPRDELLLIPSSHRHKGKISILCMDLVMLHVSRNVFAAFFWQVHVYFKRLFWLTAALYGCVTPTLRTNMTWIHLVLSFVYHFFPAE